MDENREISSTCTSVVRLWAFTDRPSHDAKGALEKSDCAVLPVNRPNKGRQLSAEVGEGRVQLKENIAQSRMLLTLSRNMHVPAFGRCA